MSILDVRAVVLRRQDSAEPDAFQGRERKELEWPVPSGTIR